MDERTDIAIGVDDVDIDTNAQSFLTRRHDVYAELRARCPVVRNQAHGGYWLVTGYEEVSAVARDNDTYAHKYEPDAPDGIDYVGICGHPRTEGNPRQGVSETDGEYHKALRRALNPFFTPAAAEAWRPEIEACAHWFLDQKIKTGAIDLTLDYATPVPALVTLQMVGLPSENWHHYAELFHSSTAYPRESPEYLEAVSHWPAIIEELYAFAGERRAAPTDDLTSMLVTTEVDGRIPDDAAVTEILFNLVAGGLDTTTSLVSLALHHLSTHPGLRQQLVGDRSLMPLAVEEFLRYFSPNEALTRTVTTDVELGGRALSRGDVLMLSWVSANRDERIFDRADEIVLDRADNHHLAFGSGGHRCIGANLARVEAAIMIETVLERMPDYVVDEARYQQYPGHPLLTGVVQMPATFTPGEPHGTTRPY